MGSPLWKRGAKGDFIGSFDSIGVGNKGKAGNIKGK
jgi:hypothetical protein